MAQTTSRNTETALMKRDLDSIMKDVSEIKTILKNDYVTVPSLKELHSRVDDIEKVMVTKEQFSLVRGIVFGGVGLVLLSFMGAIVSLVITRLQ